VKPEKNDPSSISYRIIESSSRSTSRKKYANAASLVLSSSASRNAAKSS
jgi:hypothetical protein